MQIDQLIRSKRKTIGIEVRPGGLLVVRAPLHASQAQIAYALKARAGWIESARERMAKLPAVQLEKRYSEGQLFWYLGKQYPLHIVQRQSPKFGFNEKQGFLLSASHQSQAEQLFIAWYRKQTRKLVSAYIQAYVRSHGFKPGELRITSARTRWGSCSGRNDLNFSYRLAMARESAVEYVVVHELVHTRVKNHSTAFWKAVTEIYPTWKQERAWLNQYGLQLHLVA